MLPLGAQLDLLIRAGLVTLSEIAGPAELAQLGLLDSKVDAQKQ